MNKKNSSEKNKKETKAKLELNRQVLRTLTIADLTAVVGGEGQGGGGGKHCKDMSQCEESGI
jgi:hypothetical protein